MLLSVLHMNYVHRQAISGELISKDGIAELKLSTFDTLKEFAKLPS